MTENDPPPGPPAGDATAAALAALQAQVEELAARFVALAGFAAGPAVASDPAPDAAEPAGTPEGATPAKPVVERAWWWPRLSGEDTAQAAERLAGWVEHALLARHPQHGQMLQPCWWRHPAIVDELSALRAVWHGAYAAPDRDPNAAAEYLNRWLPATMTRIAATFERNHCTVVAGKDVHQDTDEKYQRAQWTRPEIVAFHAAHAPAPVAPAQM